MHKLEAMKLLCLAATERVRQLSDKPHMQTRLVEAIEIVRTIVNQESDTQFLRKPLSPSDTHG